MAAEILIDLPERVEGERVVVRPYRSGDGAALYEAVQESREHIEPWLPWGESHSTPEDSEALVRKFEANWLLRSDLALGIFLRQDGRYLGGTGLHRIDWKVRSFEIGYWIRASEHRKGYVTEAVDLLAGMAFDRLNANRVFIRCATGNERSAAVPRRLGFELEGILKNSLLDTKDRLCDVYMFGCTPERWRSRPGNAVAPSAR